MLIAETNHDTLVCVTQGDHARLAGELLRLWRIPELVDHPRRAALLTATTHHDDGWQRLDAAPRVDESGNPHDFRSLPLGLRVEAWEASAFPPDPGGAELSPPPDEYASTLIRRHALELTRSQGDTSEVSNLRQRLREVLEQDLEALGLDRTALESDYRWLALADALSLLLCLGRDESFQIDAWRGLRRGSELLLEPFPLAGTTRFDVACRQIPKRRYRDSTDLTMELVTARWTRVEFRLRPLEN